MKILPKLLLTMAVAAVISMGRRSSAFPKIKDVADRASVSIGTVSRVLNGHQDVGLNCRNE